MMGRTRCNKIVVFDGAERHRGQVMEVSRSLEPARLRFTGTPPLITFRPTIRICSH